MVVMVQSQSLIANVPTGLMITAFSKAAQALGDASYLVHAVRAASFIKGHLYSAEKGVLVRNGYRDKNG